jgi:hypothetical protein
MWQTEEIRLSKGVWRAAAYVSTAVGKSRCKVEVAAYVNMAGGGADARSARHKNV